MFSFCKTVVTLALLMVVAGCSRPIDAVIPTDPALWETQLAPSLKKMNPEERKLLEAYLVRVTAGRIIRAGKGVPPNTTTGTAINDQRDVSERLTKAAAQSDGHHGGDMGKDRHTAGEWSALTAVPSDTDSTGEITTAEIDASSIKEHDGYRQVWWRQNFVPPRPSADTKGVVGTIFHLSLLDCKNNRSAFLIKASYAAQSDQKALLHNESRTRAEVLDKMKAVKAGSYAESALRFACTHPIH